MPRLQHENEDCACANGYIIEETFLEVKLFVTNVTYFQMYVKHQPLLMFSKQP